MIDPLDQDDPISRSEQRKEPIVTHSELVFRRDRQTGEEAIRILGSFL